MANNPPQNFENHVRIDTAAFGVGFLYLITLILALVAAYNGSMTLMAIAVAILAIGAGIALEKARTYGRIVQDRVIRLEMRIRLGEVLDSDLAARAQALSLRQIIALRFASDDELPELVRWVLDENVTDTKAIKRAVKNWQADYLRV